MEKATSHMQSSSSICNSTLTETDKGTATSKTNSTSQPPTSDRQKTTTQKRQRATSDIKRSQPVSKIYRVRNLEASPWVGAHRSSGRCPSRTWVGSSYLGKGPVDLDRGTDYPLLTQPLVGCNAEESRVRSDAAPLILSSSGCEHVLCQTAQTPTLRQWVPAARHDMGCSH